MANDTVVVDANGNLLPPRSGAPLNLPSNTTVGGVAIGTGAVNSVNGLTGTVTLTKSTIGLPYADNTSDVNKPISSATQAALNNKQAASIALTSFDSITNPYAMIYRGNGLSGWSELSPNTSATLKFLSMLGNGTSGAAPVWYTLGSMALQANTGTTTAPLKGNGSGGVTAMIPGTDYTLFTNHTPASSSESCTTGSLCWDANYIYLCPNGTWSRRVAHSSW